MTKEPLLNGHLVRSRQKQEECLSNDFDTSLGETEVIRNGETKQSLLSIPINTRLFISRDSMAHGINRKGQINALRKRNHIGRGVMKLDYRWLLNCSIPLMTSQAITIHSLLIIIGRNSIKGGPKMTLESSLSGGMPQIQILHAELACYCVKLFPYVSQTFSCIYYV